MIRNSSKKIGISGMEPMLPGEGASGRLIELAMQLMARSSALEAQLHPVVSASIGTLLRSMNCYYSNLIEGHNTHPRNIEKALHDNFSRDVPRFRSLQDALR